MKILQSSTAEYMEFIETPAVPRHLADGLDDDDGQELPSRRSLRKMVSSATRRYNLGFLAPPGGHCGLPKYGANPLASHEGRSKKGRFLSGLGTRFGITGDWRERTHSGRCPLAYKLG
jgi:hypothetical protein